MKYEPTIGIECHVQLDTKTKLFTAVANDARQANPNTLVSPLCLGLPGTLPVLNKQAVYKAIAAAKALNCKVNSFSKFDRKHYFYADLPLGYQITQFDERIIGEGELEVVLSDRKFKVRIEGAHLEADAGKSTHPSGADYSLVDLNRAGTPLLEIVTKPDIHSAADAKAFAQELQRRMKFSAVSKASLFYGNMRFDVNISLAESGSKQLGTRAEIKNLNSFKSVERAVQYEIKRQTALLERGEKVLQETRGWDDAKQKTFSQRSKEDAHDYRYFPEPNIPPIQLSDEYIKEVLAETPAIDEVREQLADFASTTQANILFDHPELLRLVLDLVEADRGSLKRGINWLTVDVLGVLKTNEEENNEDEIEIKLTSSNLSDLNKMVNDGQLNSTGAKQILAYLIKKPGEVQNLAAEMNLVQTSDEGAVEEIVRKVMSDNQEVVEQIKAGEEKAIGFLVGQIMKESKGQANPGLANKIIRKIIDE